MRPRMARAAWIVLACAGLLLLEVSTAAGARPERLDMRPWMADDPRIDRDGVNRPDMAMRHAGQHGPMTGHLPPRDDNLELVGKLEPTEEFGDILPEQIADVAVYKGYAYLNSWNEPTCRRGGTFVVDIRNPRRPEEAGFIRARDGYYHGEGAHVISVNTPQFRGDILAVNDEANFGCGPGAPTPPPADTGGFDLYDVTNPDRPRVLIRNAGDRSPESSLVQNPTLLANSIHSVFAWRDGSKAYLVATDNTEFSDLDIYDITEPRNPVQITDIDLATVFPEVVDQAAHGAVIYHHDVVVKRIGGRMRMLLSYWDGGYLQLDVTDPRNPTLLGDTDFDDPDPLTGFDPPEGNAHQAEYSRDNRFFLAADEDFGPYRLTQQIDGQQVVKPFGIFVGVPVRTNGAPIPDFQIAPGDPLAGRTIFIGDGCNPAAIPAPPAGVTVAVAERGGVAPGGAACGFQLKAQNAEAAGYEGLVIFNNVAGAEPPNQSVRCEVLLNMQYVEPFGVTIKSVFVGRADGLRILKSLPPNYHCAHNDPNSTPAPPVGTLGGDLRFGADFDGWGYAHLFDANTSERLDSFAIPEALDERFAEDFGILSIHEFATDPTEDLVYSWRGAWIDEGGSNFWGIEQFTTPNGRRLIAGSDRDYGLVILRYTGPGAPRRPRCESLSISTKKNRDVRVPLRCRDRNGNPLELRIVSEPRRGTLDDLDDDSVWYSPDRGFTGRDSFEYVANDGAADSRPAEVTIRVR
jgi:hypothetical protein